MNKQLFPGILFLRIIFNIILLPNFSFRLTRKPYPKFWQISTIGFFIKSSVTHISGSDWNNYQSLNSAIFLYYTACF